MSRTDVVVVSRDTRDATLRCVASVRATTALARLVVVDNGSADGTVEAVRAAAPRAAVLAQDPPSSFAAACNLGARQGKAELVLFLNGDVAARAGAVGRLVAALDSSRSVAATGRLVAPGSGRPQVGFAVRGFPTLAAQLAQLVGAERAWPGNPISRRQLALDFDYDSTHEIDEQPAGACLLCRRTAFESVGGFDEGFPFWFEDVDLVRRLRPLGTILYVHDAVFEHEGGLSVRGRPRHELVGARYIGLVRYFDKHSGLPSRAGIRAGVVVSAAGRAVAAAASGRRREAKAYVRGATDAIRPRR